MKPVLFAALLALAAPQLASAQAAPAVALKSETFVARTVTDAAGNKKNELQPATRVLPGDPLVFILSWKNNSNKAVTGFVINNPVPRNTVYTGAKDPAPLVSVDGGKTFGPLAAAKVRSADGTMRAATAQDVQVVRWTLAQPIAPGGTGNVVFFAMVK